MIEFLLIRHGDTLWSEQKRYQGHRDIPLSARGKKQVRYLSKVLPSYNPEVLYCSTLLRAKESAGLLFKSVSDNILYDKRLNELNFGRWEGKSADELMKERDPRYLRWMRGSLVQPPGGESMISLKRRVCSFMRECYARHEGRTVAIVSHGGVLRMFLMEALCLSRKHWFRFSIDTAALTILSVYSGYGQLMALNTTSPRGRLSNTTTTTGKI